MTTFASIIDALERAPSTIVPLVKQADPSIVKCRPPSGKWSIHEHACHLADVHDLFMERLDLMLSRDDAEIRSFDPGRDHPDDRLLHVDLDDALRRFEADRRRLVQRIRRLSPDDWRRTARHDEYNSYSVFIMLRHVALHDFSHAYRIEDLLLRRDWPAPSPLPD
jgi:uncharacterized damage-inducible protein DinB